MYNNLENKSKFNISQKNLFIKNIKDLTEEIAEILIEKNSKYGNSFYEGLNEIKKLYKQHTKENSLFNYVHQLSFYVREKDKLNRLKYLISSDISEEVKKSKTYDAVLDIIGYGILFLNYLKNEE